MTMILRNTALRHPAMAVPLLRTYLQRTPAIPERLEWVVDDLKRNLPLEWERRTITLDDGNALTIDSRSAVGREVFYRGTYEPELCRALARYVKPGMICIDAGANIGEFTLRCAVLAGSNGQVHAFEASPSTFADLDENVRQNRFTNIVTQQRALASTSGTLEFYMSRGIASGSSSLRPAHDFTGAVVPVPSVSFDDYMREVTLKRVDFIKMDIEGGELDALRGATAMLSATHAPVIVFEHHDVVARRFGASQESVIGLLEGFGYSVSPLGSSAGAPKDGGAEVAQNLVAIPRKR